MKRASLRRNASAAFARLRPILGGAVLGLAGLSFAWALVLGSGAAWGHHGFGGRYDLSAPVWIEGEVTRAYFGQPHAELVIRVADDLGVPAAPPDLGSAATFLDPGRLQVRADMRGASVEVELPPTQKYFSLGERIAVGDRIAIIAVRNCDPPHQLNGQWLRLADGEIVARAGAMSYMVGGC
ncbi:DUF6152 family protein [Aurantimonas endophytica]|uniref:Uncharacterized protein n=1 Tax=Aurantimonas endophytica TaxID=1522175 RepID=A0A7W6MRY4_9HYPH|nr:DUF6152 family protein [Aurantimonas endophytica]MBB4005540.1 hypothetical protein [Aurantimonas endophytica]MCO6406488.1 hypothetical protein [Aurantimonas endophytica]